MKNLVNGTKDIFLTPGKLLESSISQEAFSCLKKKKIYNPEIRFILFYRRSGRSARLTTLQMRSKMARISIRINCRCYGAMKNSGAQSLRRTNWNKLCDRQKQNRFRSISGNRKPYKSYFYLLSINLFFFLSWGKYSFHISHPLSGNSSQLFFFFLSRILPTTFFFFYRELECFQLFTKIPLCF